MADGLCIFEYLLSPRRCVFRTAIDHLKNTTQPQRPTASGPAHHLFNNTPGTQLQAIRQLGIRAARACAIVVCVCVILDSRAVDNAAVSKSCVCKLRRTRAPLRATCSGIPCMRDACTWGMICCGLDAPPHCVICALVPAEGLQDRKAANMNHFVAYKHSHLLCASVRKLSHNTAAVAIQKQQ